MLNGVQRQGPQPPWPQKSTYANNILGAVRETQTFKTNLLKHYSLLNYHNKAEIAG
jgi:hypothetical protein